MGAGRVGADGVAVPDSADDHYLELDRVAVRAVRRRLESLAVAEHITDAGAWHHVAGDGVGRVGLLQRGDKLIGARALGGAADEGQLAVLRRRGRVGEVEL